ncbi:MAG TPA: cytochrome c oxidase assembly protein [Ktedonobacterales bacterium]|nr:cytochrome c oxidase assembly protein [Ktedonobacterales bacterium]
MTFATVLSDWQIEPTIVVGLVIAAALYWRGARYSRRAGLARHLVWWRACAFATGLLVVFFALDSALDTAADVSLTAHMAQHELLVMVAAPLLLVGAPLWPIWRAVPLAARRATLGWAIERRWPRQLGHVLGAAFFGPAQALAIFIAGFSVWHIPALYEAALASGTLHAAEHMCFLAVALLFWSQVLPSRPLRPRLSYAMRMVYLGVAGLYSSVMGSVFMFSTAPFYPHYVAQQGGAASALVDQHLAGSAMDIPGVLVLFVAMSALLWLWLRDEERQQTAAAHPLRAASPRQMAP